MRVLLSAWGSRGDVEPLAGLAVGLRELGAEVRVCAPPDEEFVTLPATGLMPAGARSVAEKLGIRYVFACFRPFGLPSRRFPPQSRPGRPSPREETDLKVLWEQDARRVNELYGEAENSQRAVLGLPPVDNVRDYAVTDRPWLAADPALGPWRDLTDLDLVQTGAWILPDERPLPEGLEAFREAGAPPVYVGFDSTAAACSLPATGPTWPRSTTSMTVSSSARSTSRRCSAGWPPSCTTAARAPRRRPPGSPSWASARTTTVRLRPSRPCRLDMIDMIGMTGREKPRMSA